MDLYRRVRRAHYIEGKSVRQTARLFDLHRQTVRKMLEYSVPPGYQRKAPPHRPKLAPYVGSSIRYLMLTSPFSRSSATQPSGSSNASEMSTAFLVTTR